MSLLQVCIFFDGTGNNAHNVDLYNEEKFPSSNYKYSSYAISKSNVFRLYEMYISNPNNKKNIAIYVEGIGTQTGLRDNDVAKALGKVFRRSEEEATLLGSNKVEDRLRFMKINFRELFEKVKDGVEAGESFVWGLAHTKGYCADDKLDYAIEALCDKLSHHIDSRKLTENIELDINVFGFSRGAALARHFANVINDKNSIYSQKIINLIDQKNQFYKKPPTLSINHKLNFIGIFDTVESFKNFGFNTNVAVEYNKFQQNVSKLKCHVYHLTAAHEYRKNFSLTSIFENASSYFDGEITKIGTGNGYELIDSLYHKIEFCVPGCHADIGGGYKDGVHEKYILANEDIPKESGNLEAQLNIFNEDKNFPSIVVDAKRKIFIEDKKVRLDRPEIDGYLQYVNLLLMADAAEKLGGCSLSQEYIEYYKNVINTKELDEYYSYVNDISNKFINGSIISEPNVDYNKYKDFKLSKFIHFSAYVDNLGPKNQPGPVIQSSKGINSSIDNHEKKLRNNAMQAIFNNENYSLFDKVKHSMIANEGWKRGVLYGVS